MKPETLERRIYKRIRKKGKVPWENLTDYPPNNIFQSKAAKKGYHSTHVYGVSLLSPFEVDPCPSGVVTIHSHCQVLVISIGWQNVQSLIHSVKIDLISESSFAKSTLKRKRDSIVKCISLKKYWPVQTKNNLCAICINCCCFVTVLKQNMQGLTMLRPVLIKADLTGKLLLCVPLSPFSSLLVLPGEQCEGIVLHLLGNHCMHA